MIEFHGKLCSQLKVTVSVRAQTGLYKAEHMLTWLGTFDIRDKPIYLVYRPFSYD